MSSPSLNNLILCGAILMFLNVVVTGFDYKRIGAGNFATFCKVSIWLIAIGFTLTFGSMFSKTWRVYTIFTSKDMRRRVS